jgi:deoxycytidine triphosphate deaminase
MLDRKKQLEEGAGSVDLRLGQDFALADPAMLCYLDPLEQDEERLIGYLRAVHVSLGGRFVLHPRQFALGATLEYVRLPTTIAAHVIGRSRWARVGLIIAMATYVHPGYSGCLTLELQNLGDAPIQLSPGLAIAQLVLETVSPCDQADRSQIVCAVGPQFRTLMDKEEQGRLLALRKVHGSQTGDTGWPDTPPTNVPDPAA